MWQSSMRIIMLTNLLRIPFFRSRFISKTVITLLGIITNIIGIYRQISMIKLQQYKVQQKGFSEQRKIKEDSERIDFLQTQIKEASQIDNSSQNTDSNLQSPNFFYRQERNLNLMSQSKLVEGWEISAAYDQNVHQNPNHQLFSLRNQSICDYQKIMSNEN